jgi:2-polyprenyl-6-methoxyphenol hydroxylase-like FAD-dependent oxidoreductase
LLGDAAFVARPHTAMGVAKAAGDALALRARLSESADIEAALAAYDRDRRPVGASISARGRQLGKALE